MKKAQGGLSSLTFIMVFWTGLVIMNIFLASYINQFTNVDTEDYDKGFNVIDIGKFYLKMLAFQVTEEVPYWITLILWSLNVITLATLWYVVSPAK